jgi:hypothetical protein
MSVDWKETVCDCSMLTGLRERILADIGQSVSENVFTLAVAMVTGWSVAPGVHTL